MNPSVRVAGHAVTRRRDPRVTIAAASVVCAAMAITITAAIAASRAPTTWTPLAIPIGIFLIVALVRPLEPAPGEKLTVGAAVAFFAAGVLPLHEAVVLVVATALLAKIALRASLLNTAVNVSIMTAATATAATILGSFIRHDVIALAAAGGLYVTVTLVGVGSMVLASQGPRAASAFVRRELLPTSTLVSVGAIGAVLWTQDVLAIAILAVPLAAIERGLRVAARERAAVAALRSASEAQRQFTEDAAHELRTPLTALIGDLAYVHADVLPPAEAEALSSARRTAAALRHLTERLLAFARAGGAVEGGRADLADAARDVLVRVGARPGVAVRIAAPQELEVAMTPELLRIVVQDILANAAAYTESGTIDVTVETRGGRAVLRVTDTGLGIRAEEVERVFDRFYRGSRARALAPGTGLGLAIVRRIVEAHGGSITLTSPAGGGTIVEIELSQSGSMPAGSTVLERS